MVFYHAKGVKNVLQLSGGQTVGELTTFKAYIESFGQVLEGDYLGGKAINLGKETSQAVEVVDVVGVGVVVKVELEAESG